jgi:hypothetical protein
MKKLILLVATVFFLNGCSVYMAAKQPDKKDVSIFKVGTPRAVLLAEFGLPIVAEERDGKKYEIYKFLQGYGAGAKAGRAVFHGLADVATLGLWELVGTPTEGVFDGDEIAFRVRYDKDDRVDEIVRLTQ